MLKQIVCGYDSDRRRGSRYVNDNVVYTKLLHFICFLFQTDGIHANDEIRPGSDYPETLSEGTKILKGEYVLKV